MPILRSYIDYVFYLLVTTAFLFSAALSIQADAAEFERPVDGSSWEMNFEDEERDILYLGEVRFENNKYYLKLTGGIKGGQYFPIPDTPELESEVSSDHKRVVFKIEKLEARDFSESIFFAQEIFRTAPPAGTPEGAQISRNFSIEDVANQIPNEDDKPGFFIGKRQVSQEEYDAEARKTQAEGTGVLDYFNYVLMLADQDKQNKPSLGFAGATQAAYSIDLPWVMTTQKYGKDAFGTPTVEFEEQNITYLTPISVMKLQARPGFELILDNPYVSEDGEGQILWNWSMKYDSFGVSESEGGANKDKRFIVFGTKPEIISSFVAEDQLKRTSLDKKHAIFPYPFDEDGEPVKGPVFASTDSPNYRHMFVLGRNLINEDGTQTGRTELVNKDDKLQYLSASAEHIGFDGLDKFLARYLPQNFDETAKEKFVSDAKKLGEEAHIVLVEIILKPNVKAGKKDILYFGEKIDWQLDFGDNGLIIRFVRMGLSPTLQVSGRTTAVGKKEGSVREEARHIMMRDQIAIEAIIEGAHPIDKLDIALISPKDGHKLLREPSGLVRLKPAKGEKRTFRSDTFIVADRAKLDDKTWSQLSYSDEQDQDYIPKDQAIALRPGKRMRAQLTPNSENIFQRRYIGDTVTISENEKQVHGRFIDALKRSYKCDGQDIGDYFWEELTLEQENEISVRYRFKTTKAVTRINYGDHAALLMVRDLFVKRLSNVRESNAKMRTNSKVLLSYFNRWQKRSVDENAPQSILKEELNVPGLGEAKSFEYWLDNADKLKLTELQKVYVASVSIERQIEYIDRALESVGDPLDCDSAALVARFGDSTTHLIDEIVPTLMREELNDDRVWIVQPDPVARAFFNGLKYLKFQADMNDNIASRDTDMIKACLFVASAPFGFGLPAVASYVYGAEVGTGVVLSGIAFAADAIDAGITVHRNLSTHLDDDELLEFARGASFVLGEDYLLDAEGAQTSKMLLVFDTMLSLIGTAGSAADFAGDLTDTGRVLTGNFFDSETFLTRAGEASGDKISKWMSGMREMSPDQLRATQLSGSKLASELIAVPEGVDPSSVHKYLPGLMNNLESSKAQELAIFLSASADDLADPAQVALQGKFIEAMNNANVTVQQTQDQLGTLASTPPGLIPNLWNGATPSIQKGLEQLGRIGDLKEDTIMDLPFDIFGSEYGVYDNMDGLFSPKPDVPDSNFAPALIPDNFPELQNLNETLNVPLPEVIAPPEPASGTSNN